jgi:hypothetical protein
VEKKEMKDAQNCAKLQNCHALTDAEKKARQNAKTAMIYSK